MIDKSREEFELAVLNSELLPCNSVVKDKESGEYASILTKIAWLSWKLSREALCVELPEAPVVKGREDFVDYLDRFRVALDEVGVEYK